MSRIDRLSSLLAVFVPVFLLALSAASGSFAATKAPPSPPAAWSIETHVAIPAMELAARGAGRARSEMVEPVAARMREGGMAVQVKETPGTGDGTAYEVKGSSSGTVDDFRRLIHRTMKPEVRLLGRVAELTINGKGAPATATEIVIAANPSTGYRWTVADESGFTEGAKTGFVMHTRGIGVPQHQIIHLRNDKQSASPIKLVYRRSWEQAPVTLRLNLELEALPPRLDLSDPEAPAGPAPLPPEEVDATGEILLSAAASLPSEFDWRWSGMVPPVRNQRSCGSCWAFATVGVMESALLISSTASADLSEQFLVSCNTDGGDCDGGYAAHKYHFDTLGKSQTAIGAVLESAKPYSATNGTCNQAYSHPYRLGWWESLSGNPTIEDIKWAIYNHGPIVTTVCSGSAFHDYYDRWDHPRDLGVFSTDESSQCGGGTNHMVVLVGWDDNNGNGFWKLRNSWGTYWGYSGYMQIKYGTSNVGRNKNSWVTTSPRLKIEASPATVSLFQGVMRTATVSTTTVGTFNSNVSLSVSGLPAGVTAQFSSNIIPPPGNGSSSLVFTATPTAVPGNYPVTVTATGGGFTRTTNLTLALTSGSSGSGSTTTTLAGGEWRQGNMFDVTAVGSTLKITRFDLYLADAAGTAGIPVNVYYKRGSYVGSERSPGAWTLLNTYSVTSAGQGNPSPMPIDGLTIPVGQVVGIYITRTDGSFLQNTWGSNTYENASIKVNSGAGLIYPFGTTWSPWTWDGTIYYNHDTTSFFYEGFETGTLAGWAIDSDSYTRTVTNLDPAFGTYSFMQTGGDNQHYDGISRSFPSINPTRISFYVKTAETYNSTATFVVGDNDVTTNHGIIFFQMYESHPNISYGESWRSGGDCGFGKWCHIEFRNIDWSGKSFDFYVNGALKHEGVPFRSKTTTSLTRLHLYNFSIGQSSFDEIVMDMGMPKKKQILYHSDHSYGTDYLALALATLPATYVTTTATSFSGFETEVSLGGWDLAILNVQLSSTGGTAAMPIFTSHVQNGGKAIFTDKNQFSSFGSLFGINYSGNNNQTPLNITYPMLSTGIVTNPVPLDNPGSYVSWSFGMTPAGSGTSLATFPNGNSAIFLGNSGRTIINGMLNDTIASFADGVTLYRNEILLLLVDATPPTTTAAPAGGAYTGKQSVALTCVDTSSPAVTPSGSPAKGAETVTATVADDCAATYYCLGSGCTPATAYDSNTPITISSSGTLRFYSVDNSGNIESVKQQVYNITNFNLTASPTMVQVPQLGSGQTTVSTTLSGGFNSAVSLSASGLPSGINAQFSPGTIPAPGAGSSTLTFTAVTGSLPGTYLVWANGTGGGLTGSQTLYLNVYPVPPLLFKVSGLGTYETFGGMYGSLGDGSNSTALARGTEITERVILDRNVGLTLKGGYNETFSNATGSSIINGFVEIGKGSLTIDRFIIK
jgi:inhibitor of cysteine peptidase